MPSQISMREQVLHAFSFLFRDFGFVFCDDSGSDGESTVVAESGTMRIRFIRDRADFFIDVGRAMAPEEWMGLYDVLDLLKSQGKIDANYKYSNKVVPLTGALRRNYIVVREYLDGSTSPRSQY